MQNTCDTIYVSTCNTNEYKTAIDDIMKLFVEMAKPISSMSFEQVFLIRFPSFFCKKLDGILKKAPLCKREIVNNLSTIFKCTFQNENFEYILSKTKCFDDLNNLRKQLELPILEKPTINDAELGIFVTTIKSEYYDESILAMDQFNNNNTREGQINNNVLIAQNLLKIINKYDGYKLYICLAPGNLVSFVIPEFIIKEINKGEKYLVIILERYDDTQKIEASFASPEIPKMLKGIKEYFKFKDNIKFVRARCTLNIGFNEEDNIKNTPVYAFFNTLSKKSYIFYWGLYTCGTIMISDDIIHSRNTPLLKNLEKVSNEFDILFLGCDGVIYKKPIKVTKKIVTLDIYDKLKEGYGDVDYTVYQTSTYDFICSVWACKQTAGGPNYLLKYRKYKMKYIMQKQKLNF